MSIRTRLSDKLPVHIVEQHNDVVPFMHRAIASKLLPFSGIPIIHLDSHPDLLIPIHLDADTVLKPNELYESLSIENWLLPLSYAKHIDHVIWVKPPWANQIEASQQSFSIGKCSRTGKVRLSSKENYFITDGLFCPPRDLTNSTKCKLTVVELCPKDWKDLDPGYIKSTNTNQRQKITSFIPSKVAETKSSSAHNVESSSDTSITNGELHAENPTSTQTEIDDKVSGSLFEEHESWSRYLQGVVTGKPYILDIDLDFFSTMDPFRETFQSKKELVQRVFKYPNLTGVSNEELEAFTSSRQKQLQNLENFFTALDEKWLTKDETISISLEELTNMSLEDLSGLDSKQMNCFCPDEQKDLKSLCQNVLPIMKENEMNFSQIYDFGCTLDDTELPHHISSDVQIDALGSSFNSVLEHLPKPAIVTISRSSHDDYCPKDQVDEIEVMVLKLLAENFGSLDITKNFDDE